MGVKRQSLNKQFKIVTVVIALFLLGGWILSNQYVNNTISRNTKSLALRDEVNSEIANLRLSLWQTDNLLNNLMLTQDQEHKRQLNERLRASKQIVLKLKNVHYNNGTEFQRSVDDIQYDNHALQHDIEYLLRKSTDPYWVYPMLSYIDILLDSNEGFETACTLALQEIVAMKQERISTRLYRLVVKIRSQWRLKILNFRAVVIRYAGLNTKNIVIQERNIAIIQRGIKENLLQLEAYKKKGMLGLVTATSLNTMQQSAEKWDKDFINLTVLRKSSKWRRDIQYIKTNISPKQHHLLKDLLLIENRIAKWSSSNIVQLENTTHQINSLFGFLSGMAILLTLSSYILLKRSVLKPIKRISDTISTENSYYNISSRQFDSMEISLLIDAFNGMRKQINNRQKALEYQALHDSLTGLPNRALLEDRLKVSISVALRNNSKVIFMLLDLNRFKDINDTLGHSAGDSVLKISAQRLEACLRETDTVARLGGDEFAIITNGDLDEACALIMRISLCVEEDMLINEQHLYISSSIGVAVYPEHGRDVETLIQHADIAMYESKRGKKKYAIYSEKLDANSIDSLALLGSLRGEIYKPTKQLLLNYQPQIDIKTNRVIGVEALLRWTHPVFGNIPPEEIIRMAEQTGLISELTKWIIEEAFKHCSMLNSLGLDMHVAINLSAWNIQDPNLPNTLGLLLNKYKIDPTLIELEITESTVMRDPVRAREVLDEISEMGFGVFIDDFGTGFSSLSYLKLLPVNSLKIDKSFVIEMMRDDNDKIIVQSTIELAHNLGLSVVAEGVEDKETLESLSELNCDYVQGYYLSVPLSSKDLIGWLQSRNIA